nr:ribonuclease H-like domain-containing protein [Tanacetum cinerariifolium]
MGIPNEYQLKYKSIKDAKQLIEAIKKRFGGIAATKKTQRNLLKQQYENFTASNSKMLDQTFDRPQKLSGQVEDGPNYALMAYFTSSSDSKVSTDSKCSKTYLKTIETLKSQNEKLLKDLKKSKLMVLGYKSGLKSLEKRLEFFKINESICSEDIKKLKFKIHCNEITIRELRKKIETIQKEKDGIQLTIEKLENTSKSLNKLIGSQIMDNCKKGLGYNAVSPPHIGLFMPPKPNLSYIGLEEFTSEPAVKTLNAKTSKDVPKVVKNDNGDSIIKDWKSNDEDESVAQPKIEKKTVKPSVAKVEFVKPKQHSQNARKLLK